MGRQQVFVNDVAITPLLRVELIVEVSSKTLQLNYDRHVPLPSHSKWTKDGPATDRILLLTLNGQIQYIGEAGTGSLDFSVKVDKDLGAVGRRWIP